MARKKIDDIESKRYTAILEIDNWQFSITHNKYQRDKDWPEPVISEYWEAKSKVVYSDCPKYKAGDVISVWTSVDYEYTVYNLRKDFQFKDQLHPEREFASISYDEYMKRREENSNHSVGHIEKDRFYTRLPKEIADRLAMCPQMCKYIDLYVYRQKGKQYWLAQSVSFASFIDWSIYE